MPDSLSLWRCERSTDANGVRLLTIFVGCDFKCVFNWDERFFFAHPWGARNLFWIVESIRRPNDPPAVDILCHLLPERRELFRVTDVALLEQRLKELL